MITTATLFTDGASRGNPGPTAVAYRTIDAEGGLLEARATRISNATNNEAEYAALAEGLEACRRLGIQAVRAVSDSELIVRQIEGSYRAKEPRLATLRDALRQLIARLSSTLGSSTGLALTPTLRRVTTWRTSCSPPPASPRSHRTIAVSDIGDERS